MESFIPFTLEDYSHTVAPGRCRDGESPGLGVKGSGSESAKQPFSSVSRRKSLDHSGLEFSYMQIVGVGLDSLSCSVLLFSSYSMISSKEAGAGVKEPCMLLFLCLLFLPPSKQAGFGFYLYLLLHSFMFQWLEDAHCGCGEESF